MISSRLTRTGDTNDNDCQKVKKEQKPRLSSDYRKTFHVRASTPVNRPPIRTQQPSPVKIHRHRRKSRPLTPDIVIERRSRHHRQHHHHHGSDGYRLMQIPLDSRPTLGLRGPPKRFIEIERIPCCRRRRRCRSPCDDIDYPTSYPSTTSPAIVTNPINCYSSASQVDARGWLSTLTPEMLENLPRRTVCLSPIYLPGSQATPETPLQTVVFPAEIINPIDGSLSVIKYNQSAGSFAPPTHTQLINPAAGPFMQQLSKLIQQSVEPIAFLNQAMTNTTFPYVAQPTISSPMIHPILIY